MAAGIEDSSENISQAKDRLGALLSVYETLIELPASMRCRVVRYADHQDCAASCDRHQQAHLSCCRSRRDSARRLLLRRPVRAHPGIDPQQCMTRFTLSPSHSQSKVLVAAEQQPGLERSQLTKPAGKQGSDGSCRCLSHEAVSTTGLLPRFGQWRLHVDEEPRGPRFREWTVPGRGANQL